MYFGQGLQLYEENEHQRYLNEWQRLHSSETLDHAEKERRNELETFFAAETVGGRDIEDGWKLHAAENTVLFGHIDPSQMDTRLDLVDRCLVLHLPHFSPEMIEGQLKGRTDWNRVGEIKRSYHPKRTWNQFPIVRDQVLAILDIFHGSGVNAGDLLAKQISYLLSVAEAWKLPDTQLLAAHICQTLILPRVKGLGEDILQQIEDVETLPNLAPQLRQQLGKLKQHAVSNRLEEIRCIDVIG